MTPHIKVIGRGCSQLSNALASFNNDNPDVEGTVEVYSPKTIGEDAFAMSTISSQHTLIG